MPSRTPALSRRGLLKKGAAAAAAGAAIAAGAAPSAQGQAPAVVTGRTFRAWMSRGTGPGRTTLQDVKLRPVTGRMVVVRTEATNLCYSNVGVVLGHPGGAAERRGRAGHRRRASAARWRAPTAWR